jgi:hypothetical protein
MGADDPLYSHIDAIVHRILDGFTDNLAIFDEAREKLEKFLADEEKVAELNIQSTAEEINQTDRKEMASAVAKAEIERRIQMYPVPNFLATFLRQQWTPTARECLSQARRGKRHLGAERRDARGPRVERAAEADQGRPQAPGRAAPVAAQAALRRAASTIAAASEERERFMSNLSRRMRRR